jgi:hypothetical protein
MTDDGRQVMAIAHTGELKTYVLKGGNLHGFFFSLIDDYREN